MTTPSEILRIIGHKPIVFIEVLSDSDNRWYAVMATEDGTYPLTADKCRELAGILTRLGDSLDCKNKEGKYGKDAAT